MDSNTNVEAQEAAQETAQEAQAETQGREHLAQQAAQLHAAGVKAYQEENGSLTVVVPMNTEHPQFIDDAGKPVHVVNQRLRVSSRGWSRAGDARRTGRLFGRSETLFRYLQAAGQDGVDLVAEIASLTAASLSASQEVPDWTEVLDAFPANEPAGQTGQQQE